MSTLLHITSLRICPHGEVTHVPAFLVREMGTLSCRGCVEGAGSLGAALSLWSRDLPLQSARLRRLVCVNKKKFPQTDVWPKG